MNRHHATTARPSQRKPLSASLGHPVAASGIAVLAIALVAVLGYAIYGQASSSRLAAAAERDWITTPCIVLEADHQKRGRKRMLLVRYRYEHGGSTYVGERYSFEPNSYTRPQAEQIVQDLRLRPETTCYVNPANPAEAVLRPIAEQITGTLWTLVILLMLGSTAVAGVMIHSIVLRRRGVPDDRSLRRDLPLPPYRGPGKSMRLKLSVSKLFELAACVFMLGIGAFMVTGAVWLWRDGGRFIPMLFGIFGIGIIGLCLYLLLSIWNAKVALTVTTDAVPLGGTLDFAWDLRGKTAKVRRLQIWLEGQEHSRRERLMAKHDAIDGHQFEKVRVIDTTDAARIASGECSVTIPDDAMHSLKTEHNEIVWQLHVEAEVHRWPDINLLFPIVVLPHELGELAARSKH